MNNITIMNDDDPSEPNIDYIKAIAKYTLSCEKQDNCGLAIVCCTPSTMQAYNQTYRGKNESTDVLSFQAEDFFAGNKIGHKTGSSTTGHIVATNDMTEDRPTDIYSTEYHLGDILICREQIQKQANEYHISYIEELGRIVIHGILHLLGYTHKSYELNEPMLLKQEVLLSNYYEHKGRV